MSLLPPRFQEPLMAGPLGPVIKPAPAVPELHVHDWRPSAAGKDHVTCSCGQVSLREFVMPPEVKLSDDGQDADWASELREARRQGVGYWTSRFWREHPVYAAALLSADLSINPPVVIDANNLPILNWPPPGMDFGTLARSFKTQMQDACGIPLAVSQHPSTSSTAAEMRVRHDEQRRRLWSQNPFAKYIR